MNVKLGEEGDDLATAVSHQDGTWQILCQCL